MMKGVICTILPCKVCDHTFFAHTSKCSDCPKKSIEAQHTYVRREHDNALDRSNKSQPTS